MGMERVEDILRALSRGYSGVRWRSRSPYSLALASSVVGGDYRAHHTNRVKALEHQTTAGLVKRQGLAFLSSHWLVVYCNP